jgi:hypothetical protein
VIGLRNRLRLVCCEDGSIWLRRRALVLAMLILVTLRDIRIFVFQY